MTIDTLPAKKNYTVLTRKILIAAAFMAAGFLLSRVELIHSLAPFGPAFIAACFLSRRQETLLGVAGVILGALLLAEPVFVIMVSMIICASMLVINRSYKKRWMTLLVAAAAYIIASAVFRTNDIVTFMYSLLECCCCLVMIYVLETIIKFAVSPKKRSILSAEEGISITLGLFVFIAMFGTLNVKGVYIANILAMLLVVSIAYSAGAAFGAGTGLCLGIACCLSSACEVMIIGMLGLAGLVAGTLRKLKKPGTAISFFLVNILYVAAFYNRSLWLLVMIEAGIATVLFAAVPNKAFAFVAKYMDIKAKKQAEYKMHGQRFKELTADRLSEVSEVFLETGEMFSSGLNNQIVEEDKNISGILSLVAQSTCKSCVFKKSCWDNDFINTYNVFSKLFTVYEEKERLELCDIPESFAKRCFNTEGIINSAESVFSAYLLNLQWKKKILESRQITSSQLKGVAQVVCDLGSKIEAGFGFLDTIEQRVAAMLEQTGVRVREVCAEQSIGSGVSVGVRLAGSLKTKSMSALETAVSDACGVTMKKAPVQKSGVLRFEQLKKFDIETGLAALSKDEVSGDSFAHKEISEGRYMLLLCDGMGSGKDARQQSTAAVSLAEKFLRAGFEDSVIFDTINKLMMLKENNEAFSTVDLCMIDLFAGTAKFTKVGAECSYILGRYGVQVIKPGSLPIGILEEINPALAKKKLAAGDIIVMLSDGASDEIKGSPSDWFSEIKMGSAQQIAEAILRKAKSGEEIKDDMTVLVGKITQI